MLNPTRGRATLRPLPSPRGLMADLVADGDHHATDGVLPVRAAFVVTPDGKRLVKASAVAR